MANRAEALRVAVKFGFVLDEENTGKVGDNFAAIFDHPTHSIGGDCRSITETSYPPNAAEYVWKNCIDRMNVDGPSLTPCANPNCDYHHPSTTPSS